MLCIIIEPTEVAISYNGEDDLCSLNKDIVFSFTGFSVSGQVYLLILLITINN